MHVNILGNPQGSKESKDDGASHQCVLGSRLGAICALSLLLVPALAPRVFLRVLWFSTCELSLLLYLVVAPRVFSGSLVLNM